MGCTGESLIDKKLHRGSILRKALANPLVPFFGASSLFLSCINVLTADESMNSALIKTQATISSSRSDVANPPLPSGPLHEFQLARLVFDANMSNGWGPGRPWWRIDWPEAEMHFLQGLARYTSIDTASDSVHIELSREEIFDYPWLFAQQVGRWQLDDASIDTLGEYLRRGGFMLADDVHGPVGWDTFADVILQALPDSRIEEIPPNDSVINILYDLEKRVQIPGRRHIVSNDLRGNVDVRMPHKPHAWRGIKDADGRWVVAINYNMDMGDSWEHANDPYYPLDMTSMGYKLGINYIIYAMTH